MSDRKFVIKYQHVDEAGKVHNHVGQVFTDAIEGEVLCLLHLHGYHNIQHSLAVNANQLSYILQQLAKPEHNRYKPINIRIREIHA